MDEDGYPTEELLSQIKNYDPIKSGFIDLMHLVYDNWIYDFPYKSFYKDGDKYVYTLSTGGWSGNEELIDALMENHLWWMFSWYSSRRGGHYEFRIKTKEKRRNRCLIMVLGRKQKQRPISKL